MVQSAPSTSQQPHNDENVGQNHLPASTENTPQATPKKRLHRKSSRVSQLPAVITNKSVPSSLSVPSPLSAPAAPNEQNGSNGPYEQDDSSAPNASTAPNPTNYQTAPSAPPAPGSPIEEQRSTSSARFREADSKQNLFHMSEADRIVQDGIQAGIQEVVRIAAPDKPEDSLSRESTNSDSEQQVHT